MSSNKNEVVTLLLNIGKRLNRSEEQMKPIIKKIVEDNWLDSIESLKNLKEEDWNKLSIPIRLLEELRKELGTSSNEKVSLPYKGKTHSDLEELVKTEDGSELNHLKKVRRSLSGSKSTQNSTHVMEAPVTNKVMGNSEKEKIVSSGKYKSEFCVVKIIKEKHKAMIENEVKDFKVEEVFYFAECDSEYADEESHRQHMEQQLEEQCVELFNASDNLKKIPRETLIHAIEILSKIIRNILVNPNLLKTRILKTSNEVLKNRIFQYEPCLHFLVALGFVPIDFCYVLQRVNTLILVSGYEHLENIAQINNVQLGNLPPKYFNPYKSSIFCTDTAKKNNPLPQENTEEKLKKKKEEVIQLISKPVALDAKIYSELSSRNSTNIRKGAAVQISHTEDEEDFEDTTDVTYLMSKIKNLYKEQNFQSKTKLELEKISKAKVYEKTTLKIIFPDHNVLELSFAPGTLMREVNENIRKFLHSEIVTKEWVLYETPYVTKFELHKKLADYNLVPFAILRFKLTACDGKGMNIQYLSEEAISKYSVSL